jgi:AraC-like DNA-binding protein
MESECHVAKACQYSPTYFSRLFHSVMGKTLKQYIIQKRLNLACGLLVSERDKISNIASASGFNDVSYFSRVFKKYMGCSPGEYRINQGRSSQENAIRISESISSSILPSKQ